MNYENNPGDFCVRVNNNAYGAYPDENKGMHFYSYILETAVHCVDWL